MAIVDLSSLHTGRYATLPKHWKTQKHWFAWQVLRQGGKLQLEHLVETGLTYHPATKEASHITVSEQHAAGSGVGFAFPPEPITLMVTLSYARSESGELDPRALEVLSRLPGAYVEVGPYHHEIHLAFSVKRRNFWR
jgi:hypothetical protein